MLDINPLPDYSITWEEKGKKINIRMVYTGKDD
jgi:hypothetical protein